ncbi:MAG: C_GCAxxG_C_C family protein [Anaerolineae bacterium]|nr:C_GCAxxG_C_C family protein [Anaerolineae bacterium]
MSVVDDSFDCLLKLEEEATAPLAGGIMQHGYQCGMLWGTALAAGAQAYKRFGPGPQAETEAIMAAQRLVESFRARNHHVGCLELTGVDWQNLSMQVMLKYLITGRVTRCFGMAGRYAPVAFDEIKVALFEEHIEVPSSPVSCAAMLARKMGVSEMHAVMAAGLAGGIGLYGGGCGALGAAIWIIIMNSRKEGASKMDFENPRAKAAIDRFVECTDCEFECSEIVGRRFEDVGDHAGYLRAGGCSKIIEVLATS